MAHVPIALLTDYGRNDAYAGAMKAVILGINPEAVIFDITHDIGPQAVEEGAFVLGQVRPYLPPGSLCVAVVDPGVGTQRRPVAVRTRDLTFVGPDNGLLSPALDDQDRAAAGSAGVPRPVAIPAAIEAVELANPEFFRQPVSNTFHGRDIFAPVAARLSLGTPISALGPAVKSILAFAPWRAARDEDGTLAGRVVYVDHFGNLITDIRAEDLPPGPIEVQLGGRCLHGLQRTFHDGPEYVVYAGSSGFLEIARRNANAASALGLAAGAGVRVSAYQS